MKGFDWQLLEAIGVAAATRRVRSAGVARDAAIFAVERYVDARLQGKVVENATAWVATVASHQAIRLAIREARQGLVALSDELPIPEKDAMVVPWELNRTCLAALVGHLSTAQREVVELLLQPGMSLHRAAAVLGVDRASVRRTFRRAAMRLRGLAGGGSKDGPPPPHNGVAVRGYVPASAYPEHEWSRFQ